MVTLWEKCLETLRTELPDNIFSLWVRPLQVGKSKHDNQLILLAPNNFFSKHIQENYLPKFSYLAEKYSNGDVNDVQILVDNFENKKSAQQESRVSTSSSAKKTKTKKTYLNPLFTFADFVVGKSNQMAHETCKAVMNDLGSHNHNPLFLYGATGLGKTHLMHALGHAIVEEKKHVYYMSSEQFVNQYVHAIRNQKIDEFKARCREPDLLLVDDIHVLAGKNKSGIEFLSLFNDLIGANKQIVLTSDRYPSMLTDLDERLKSRLSWGLSVAVEPPELKTRISILQKKATSAGVHLPDDAAKFIAQQVVANVRELEGALNKVLATARFKDSPITLDLVQFALKEIVAIRAQAISIDNIKKTVAEYYHISVKDLIGKKRTRAIARPRQLAMTMTRELTSQSYPEIGSQFGKRDHSTVMHAYEKVQKLRENDPIFAKDYQTILTMLQR